MSIEQRVFELLRGFVGGRVYPDVAPLDAPTPYITYQRVGGRADTYLGPELAGTKHARVQISIWGPDRLAVSSLADDVEDAFHTTRTMTAGPLGAAVSVYEDDTKLYGSRQDFSCWYDR